MKRALSGVYFVPTVKEELKRTKKEIPQEIFIFTIIVKFNIVDIVQSNCPFYGKNLWRIYFFL